MLGGQKLLRVVFQKAAKINQVSALFEQYNNSEKIVINKSLKLKKNEIIRTKISSHLLTPDILTKIISKEPVIKPNGDRLCRKHSLSSGDNPVRFLNTSLFGQQSGRHLQNSIQRRLYATYDECGNCLDCDFDPLRPPCVEQPRTSPKEKCPPTIKREGCCCRVTMPGCKKSCRFQRKFCCIRLERPFKFCRQKTPSAAFSECRKPIIVLKTIPECTCLEGVSPCAHDRRPRKIPPPTKIVSKFCQINKPNNLANKSLIKMVSAVNVTNPQIASKSEKQNRSFVSSWRITDFKNMDNFIPEINVCKALGNTFNEFVFCNTQNNNNCLQNIKQCKCSDVFFGQRYSTIQNNIFDSNKCVLSMPTLQSRPLYNDVQKRFFKCPGCYKTPYVPVPKTGLRPPKFKPVCPCIAKGEGKCFRVLMPCCKVSCRYHRKFCCAKGRKFNFNRQRTPRPSFADSFDIHVKRHKECQCWEATSPCEHDIKYWERPDKTDTCEDGAKMCKLEFLKGKGVDLCTLVKTEM